MRLFFINKDGHMQAGKAGMHFSFTEWEKFVDTLERLPDLPKEQCDELHQNQEGCYYCKLCNPFWKTMI
jgi:hypothetical protein